jgi:ribulose-5-phosphate 4-epimerase/fuculose-1-phosphate aldolase
VPAAVETMTGATAAEVATTARLLAAAGLVEAFGHVSARLEGGGFAISSTAPLGRAAAAEVIACDRDGAAAGEGAGLPLEAPLHAAIYAARDDVGAICRTHSPAAVAAGAAGAVPPVAHGLGGLSGRVALSTEPQLVTDGERAAAAAADLGDADCLLIRGNGAVTTGPALPAAVVRAWFLEERARVALAGGTALAPADLAERARHYPAESERAWSWLRWRYGEERR